MATSPVFPGYSPEEIAIIKRLFPGQPPPAQGTPGGAPYKGVTQVSELPPPPVGTYDPVIDYNAGAAQRGFGQTVNDAQTLFEQGQEDYGLDLGDLTQGRDWSLADLDTNEGRLNEDYGLASAENTRQYGILGRQQAEGAAQRGVTSAGLLGKSAAVRSENQGRDQAKLDLSKNRGVTDIGTQRTRTNTLFDKSKTRLDLGNARTFGGFNGQVINNPLTGAPQIGSLLTGVTRAGAENTAYQTAAGQQRIGQAQAGGFISPLLLTGQPGIRTPKPGEAGYEDYVRQMRNFGGK